VGLSTRLNWLVCYDIADHRRLVRVFKLLKKHGIPIQYSVFLVKASAEELSHLEQQVMRLINPAADDVRTYRIADAQPCVEIGRPLLAEDIVIGWGLTTV